MVIAVAGIPALAKAPSMNGGFYSQQFLLPYVHQLLSVSSSTTREAYWKPIITDYALRFGADPILLNRIAKCESGYNPQAKNALSTASGMFQFLDSTFLSQSTKYGLSGDKNDPLVQIELAARMIADGGVNHWTASASCWN